MTDPTPPPADGIHALVPAHTMCDAARRRREAYAITPGAPFMRHEFGYYCLEEWYQQGLDRDTNLDEEFGYDPQGKHHLWNLGWCEAPFHPAFEVKLIEDRGEQEVEQDFAGRHVLYFKGRRSGFMPEYLDHPVKDWQTWEENVKWRLDPASPQRVAGLDETLAEARRQAGEGNMITQCVVGGYMYLRSLIGPSELLYMFYDAPDLIHDCMQTWLTVADKVTAQHQTQVTFDELYLAEDICYNGGCLISPDMLREFLFPYYQQLKANILARQLDRSRHLFVMVDTDGRADPVLPLYMEAIGLDAMNPFEVASGCDVVEIGRQFPHLFMSGGIDKRVLAEGPHAIDRHLEYIFPAMRDRGGYIPTCDHGVPPEVSLENYRYYRKRAEELGG